MVDICPAWLGTDEGDDEAVLQGRSQSRPAGYARRCRCVFTRQLSGVRGSSERSAGSAAHARTMPALWDAYASAAPCRVPSPEAVEVPRYALEPRERVDHSPPPAGSKELRTRRFPVRHTPPSPAQYWMTAVSCGSVETGNAPRPPGGATPAGSRSSRRALLRPRGCGRGARVTRGHPRRCTSRCRR